MSNPVRDSDLLRIVRRIRMCKTETAALVLLEHAVKNYRRRVRIGSKRRDGTVFKL